MVKKLGLSSLVFVVVIEFVLRLSGNYKTPNERVVGIYFYRYHQKGEGFLHQWKPNKLVDYEQPEFRYLNQYNEFGLREMALDSFLVDSGSISVLCLGDSFTEGDGTPYDSTWVKRTEYLCRQNQNSKYIFYNAGVCGSDIFFNHQWQKTEIMRLKPKQIIECINTSDIDDVIWNGGVERFNTDETWSGKTGPRWEIIYKYSHLFRAIVHIFLRYNNNLIKPGGEDIAIQKIKEELIREHDWCEENGIKYSAVLQLCPHELKTKNYSGNKLFKELSKLSFVIDLSNELQTQITPKNYLKYSWPMNGHFNSIGYGILGDVIYNKLYGTSN
ncbi:MAG: SGNH/GDSL hydrolase family protein [Bacteroidia bacterium]|nr:SGNH/GDSL hydrolase family protein [Bacteroidia bacterium]MCF8427049.1 SGNH/GDSL hydrolase family protein [Bacteroidia bacterium]MCF8446467.1 SGNH/GDSL hydrolase family protein [Bacteroidia bacterium]